MVLVALTVTVHSVFIAYVVAGGILAIRWPGTLPVHVAAVLWGASSTVLIWPCPLTSVERWARSHAGMNPLPPEGFIEHYLTGVLYPDNAVGMIQVLIAGAVLSSWLLVYRNKFGTTRTPV